MRRLHWGLVAVLAGMVTLFLLYPIATCRATEPRDPGSSLSPYWSGAVRRWESVIIEYAHQRGLDPDLVAAVVWKESLGRPYAYSPAGAVGLMQVMPREEGYPQRPTAQELEDPQRNLAWGTQALFNVICQSGGDLYLALAAYNGGWHQTHLRIPRWYAAETLAHYARAVAMRCGLPSEGHWVATLAALDGGAHGALTVLGPQRSLARYSNRPVAARIPDATTYGPPTAVVFSPPDGRDLYCRVGIWVLIDGQVVQEPEPEETAPSELPPVSVRDGSLWESLGDPAWPERWQSTRDRPGLRADVAFSARQPR